MPKQTAKPKKKKENDAKIVNSRPLDINKRKDEKAKLANVWQLSAMCLKQLWRYRWLYLGILVIYGIVNLVVARGFSVGSDPTSLKSTIDSLFPGSYQQVLGSAALFSIMLSNAGSTAGVGYEVVFLMFVSLALIWAIRNTSNGSNVRIRDAYYRGMYPIIPFIIVVLVVFVEMLPMVGGVSLYLYAVGYHITVTALEQALFAVIALLLSVLSLYWLAGSMMAMYIVTLPEMTPMKALRSAKKLVKGRRMPVLLRIIYLPIAMLVVSLVIMIPSIMFISHLSQWILLLLSLVFIAIFHSYLYNLYRELLEDEQT